MPRRPTFAESAEKPRVLFCAFAEIPGPTRVGLRAEQLLLGFSLGADVDALSLKGKHLAHIQRVGAARMLRVPVPEPRGGEPAVVAASFLDRLSVYRRALSRQLENESYDLVYALDVWSAATALPQLRRARLVVEVADLPSRSWDASWPVDTADAALRTEWAHSERTALKAASMVIAPSRQAARVASEATDPRHIQVFPHVIDTRPFAPPTVEIDLEDSRTVAFLGGREGGQRTSVLTSALKLLAARAAESSFLVVGRAGRGDPALQATLKHRALWGRTKVIDVAGVPELHAAMIGADVVVVIADPTSVALPHRALEAMACGRAVVVAAPEAACRDAVVSGQHVLVVPADAPERIAESVCALLDDTNLRARLGNAARKQAQTFDVGLRLPDLAGLVRAATGVALEAHLGALEDQPTPSADARQEQSPVSPPSPPVSSMSSMSSMSPSSSVGPVPPSASSGIARTSVSLRPDALSLPEASAELLAEPASGPGALDSLADTTLDTGRLPGASTVASTDGPRVVVDEPKHSDSVDVWAPDTMVESEAAADSASRHRAGPSLLATRVELHNPEAATKSAQTADADARFSRLSATPGVRSVLIDQDSARSHDEWSQDTIADASPVPEVSHSIAEQRRVALPRSLLVAHRFTDMTAEDEGESS